MYTKRRKDMHANRKHETTQNKKKLCNYLFKNRTLTCGTQSFGWEPLCWCLCFCKCLCLCLCYVCVSVMFVFLQMFFSLSLDWEEKGTWSFGISLTEKMEAFVGRCQTTDTSIFSWKMEKETLPISVNETGVAEWLEQ